MTGNFDQVWSGYWCIRVRDPDCEIRNVTRTSGGATFAQRAAPAPSTVTFEEMIQQALRRN